MSISRDDDKKKKPSILAAANLVGNMTGAKRMGKAPAQTVKPDVQAKAPISPTVSVGRTGKGKITSVRTSFPSISASAPQPPKIRTAAEMVADIYKIGQTDRAYSDQLMTMFETERRDKASIYYNPYTAPTNNMALESLAELGVDVSQGIDDNFFQSYAWLKNNQRTGIAGTPLAPTKSSSREESASYYYNKLLEAEDTTREAEGEWDALRKQAAYLAQRSDRNYSDEEIVKLLNVEKNYPTLAKLDRERAAGTPVQLNRGVGYSRDSIYGAIWAGRGNESSGDSFVDAVNAKLGRGTLYAPNNQIKKRLNPESQEYNPYLLGSTIDDEAALFGMSSFSKAWLDQNAGAVMANGTEDQQRAFQRIYDAELRTQSAEEELKDFYSKPEAKVTSIAKAAIRQGVTADEAIREYMSGDYATIGKLVDGLDRRSPVGITRKLDFDYHALRGQVNTAMATEKARKTDLEAAQELEKTATLSADGDATEDDLAPISKTASRGGMGEFVRDAVSWLTDAGKAIEEFLAPAPPEGAARPDNSKLWAGTSVSDVPMGGKPKGAPAYKKDTDIFPAYTGTTKLIGRPAITMGGEEYGTLYSITIQDDDGQWVNIPTIYDGKLHTENEAVAHYRKIGEHLGKYQSLSKAENEAQSLSDAMGVYVQNRDAKTSESALENADRDRLERSRQDSPGKPQVSAEERQKLQAELDALNDLSEMSAADAQRAAEIEKQLKTSDRGRYLDSKPGAGTSVSDAPIGSLNAPEDAEREKQINQAIVWVADRKKAYQRLEEAGKRYGQGSPEWELAVKQVKGYDEAIADIKNKYKTGDDLEAALAAYAKPSDQSGAVQAPSGYKSKNNSVLNRIMTEAKEKGWKTAADIPRGTLVLESLAKANPAFMQEISMYFGMTDAEIEQYNYIFDKQGEKQANEYFRGLQDTRLNAAHREGLVKGATQMGKEIPVLASAFSVATSAFGSVEGFAVQAGHYLMGEELKVNDTRLTATAFNQALREGVSQNMSDGGKFIYGTAMSILENVGSMVVGGGLHIVSMYGKSAASTMDQVMSEGGTPTQALILGNVSGLLEMLTEKLDLNRFTAGMKAVGGKGARELLKGVFSMGLKSALPEMGEEVLSELGNVVSDVMVRGENSEPMQLYRYFISEGLPEDQAWDKVAETIGGNLAMAGAGGALSGFVFGNIANLSQSFHATLSGTAAVQSYTALSEMDNVQNEGGQVMAAQVAAQVINSHSIRQLNTPKTKTELAPYNAKIAEAMGISQELSDSVVKRIIGNSAVKADNSLLSGIKALAQMPEKNQLRTIKALTAKPLSLAEVQTLAKINMLKNASTSQNKSEKVDALVNGALVKATDQAVQALGVSGMPENTVKFAQERWGTEGVLYLGNLLQSKDQTVHRIAAALQTMPTYAKAVIVAEENMKSVTLSPAAVAKQIEAFKADAQNLEIMDNASLRAINQAIEVQVSAVIAQTGPEVKTVEKAGAKLKESQTALEAAMSEASNAADIFLTASEQFNAAPHDKAAANAFMNAQAEMKRSRDKLDALRKVTVKDQAAYNDAAKTMEEQRARVRAEAEKQAFQAVYEASAQVDPEVGQPAAIPAEQPTQTTTLPDNFEGDADAFVAENYMDASDEIKAEIKTRFISAINNRLRQAAVDPAAPAYSEKNRTFMAKVEEKYGIKVVLDSRLNGRTEAFYTPGTNEIKINPNTTADDALIGVVLHELTHVAEESGWYDQYKDAVLAIKFGDDYSNNAAFQRVVEAKVKRYADVGINLAPDRAIAEIVAQETRNSIFADDAAITEFVEREPNIARRILAALNDFIQNIKQLAGVDTGVANGTMVERARALLETALSDRAGRLSPDRVDTTADKTEGMVIGKGGFTFTADTDQKIEYHWGLIDSSEIITSNNDDLSVNPDYPPEYQPKDRTRQVSQDQVNRIARLGNPYRLGDAPEVTSGAPIIGKDRVVEVGNGRAIGIRKAMNGDKDFAVKYTQWLKENAAEFGFDPDAIKPSSILVRIRDTEVNRELFTSSGNAQPGMNYSPSESAASDAKKFTPEMLGKVKVSASGDLDLSANNSFITWFISNIIPESERNNITDANGWLSQYGFTRLRNALFQRAYNDIKATAQLSEQKDGVIKNAINAMTLIAPRLAVVNEKTAAGELVDNNITRNILDAYKGLQTIRKADMDVETYFIQESMDDSMPTFDEPTKAIIRLLDKQKLNKKWIAETFHSILDVLEEQGNPLQAKNEGFEKPILSNDEIVVEGINRYQEMRDSAQVKMFSITDNQYMDAVDAGDMDTAQKMVDEAAAKSGLAIMDDSASEAYRVRRTAPPKSTVKAYKLFATKGKQPGQLFPLFVGANESIPQGVWLDAIAGKTAENSKTGKVQVKSKLGPLAYRPGWHAGDIPLATHIGVKDSEGKVYARRDNEVWAEVELAADTDYQPQADASKTRDLREMPVNGSYRFKTNPNMTGTWIISGAMKVNRVLTQNEVNSMLSRQNAPIMPWQNGNLVLENLGLTADEAINQYKLGDAITYDDNGNVIPLSQRFNAQSNDIRYSITDQDDEKIQKAVEALLAKYGAIPAGEKAVNTTSIPAQTSDEKKTRKFVRTISEADILDISARNELDRKIVAEELSYEPISDNDAMAYAAKMDKEGLKREWTRAIEGNRIPSKYQIAVGEALLIQQANEGDTDGAMTMTAELAEVLTRAGQTVQAARMLKKTTSAGALHFISRAVGKLNEGIGDGQIELNPELVNNLLNAKTPQEREAAVKALQKDAGQQIPPNWKTRLNAWRYFAMLGNPRTHIRNIVGNAIFMPAVKIKNMIGAGIEAATGQDRTKAVVLNRRLRRAAMQDAEAHIDELMGGGKYNPTDDIEQFKRSFGESSFGKGMEALTEFNTDLLEKEDGIFLKRHYANALAGYLQANGMTLDDTDETALTNARQYAVNEAKKATYRDASAFASWLNTKAQQGGIAGLIIEGIMPFKKTPANILKRGVEYSPIGLIDTLTRGVKQLKDEKITPTQFIDKIASGMTGTMIAGLGLFLNSLGLIRIGGGDDKEEEFEQQAGAQNYSIEILGHSITLDWMTPASMPLFVGASLGKLMEEEQNTAGIAEIVNSGFQALQGLMEPMFSLSMLNGVDQAITSANYNQENPITAIMVNSSLNYAGQFVPTLLGQIARTVDPERRRIYTDKNVPLDSNIQRFIEQQQNKLPMLSMKNEPYIDVWGEAESTGKPWLRALENFVSPAYINELTPDAVEDLLKEVYNQTGDPDVLPASASKFFKVNGETVNLDSKQYTEFSVVRGKAMRSGLEALMKDERFTQADMRIKTNLIKDVLEFSTQKAKLHLNDAYAADSWVRKGLEDGSPIEVVFERSEAADYKLKRQNYRDEAMKAIESGDIDSLEAATGALMQAHFTKNPDASDREAVNAAKEWLKEQVKARYLDAYKADDEAAMEQIEDALYGVGIVYGYRDWLKDNE